MTEVTVQILAAVQRLFPDVCDRENFMIKNWEIFEKNAYFHVIDWKTLHTVGFKRYVPLSFEKLWIFRFEFDHFNWKFLLLAFFDFNCVCESYWHSKPSFFQPDTALFQLTIRTVLLQVCGPDNRRSSVQFYGRTVYKIDIHASFFAVLYLQKILLFSDV